MSATYLIAYLTCNKVWLCIASSKSDIFQPVSYIWVTGINAEFHIVILIQDLERKEYKTINCCGLGGEFCSALFMKR